MKEKTENISKFGIIQVLLVVSENLIFTISADQTLRWYEATDVDTKKPPCIENPNKAIFTYMCWDYKD